MKSFTSIKSIAIALILFAIIPTSLAQDFTNDFFLSLNMVRYAPASSGFHDLDEGTNEFSLINSINLGYRQNRLGYFVEFRNVNSSINEYGIDSFEKLATKGFEANLGMMFFTKEVYRMSVAFSLEGFAEFTEVNGLQTFGGDELYEVNHHKNYFGAAPGLTINFKIAEKLSIYAKTRYRVGWVNYEGIESTVPGTKLRYDDKFYSTQFDPVSALGLRIYFYR